MIMRLLLILTVVFTGLVSQAKQVVIPRVQQMANVPRPLVIIDYKKMALDFDRIVYDFDAKGEFWPLVWIDESRKNFDQPVVGLFTALGDSRQGLSKHDGMFHESVATMGAVLGASLVGIDKSKQKYDYVQMLKNYFNKDTGWNIFQNNTSPAVGSLGGGYSRDWWYDVFPNILFYGIFDKYPNSPEFTDLARQVADRFYEADNVLQGKYDYSFFDYSQMKPVTSAICAQPDAAAGHAYVLYSAHQKFGDAKYLEGAISALSALQKYQVNPTYEVLMPFAAYTAARLNAEHGQKLDVEKFVNWSFDPTPGCRKGWGTIVGRWNGYDVSGIVGNAFENGGYGFLMNTYDMAWPLVPLVRYDQSYANAIGKWMLNAANAARLFYPQYTKNQTIPQLAHLTKGVIAYEGLVEVSTHEQYKNIPGPVAQGDGPKWTPENPQASQFSVYGSAHVGIFGSIVETTNVPGILKLDLLATDLFRKKAYPTYLFHNPYRVAKWVEVNLGAVGSVDLYDTVTGKFISRSSKTKAVVKIKGGTSRVLVLVPSGAVIKKDGRRLFGNDVVVDFNLQTTKTN